MIALAPQAPDTLESAVSAMTAEGLDGLSGDVLGTDLQSIRREIDRLEAEFCRRLERFIRLRGHAAERAASPGSWLRGTCHLSGPAAAQRVQMAHVLPTLPHAERVFRTGEIGFQHAALIAQVAVEVGPEAAREAEPTLVRAALRMDPGRLWIVARHLRHCVDPGGALDVANRQHELRRLHISQTFDGVFILDGVLTADAGAVVRTALEAITQPVPGDTRSASQRRADALVELATRQLQGGDLPSVHGQRPHLTVTVSGATLRRDVGSPGADLEWAGPVVADVARRIGCDAAITTLRIDGNGLPLSIGRTSRTVPPWMRRALVARDRGCRFPGCDRPPEWTDAHHIRHWADGGETSLENLALLCRYHHRVVHEGGVGVEGLVTEASSAAAPP